jgi:phage portal protein BeeE
MGFLDMFRRRGKVTVPSRPIEMQWRFLAEDQIIWYASDGEGMIENAYLGNHVLWAIANWKASKVASAPPLIYKVVDEKAYRKYRMLMKDVNHTNFNSIHDLKRKALEEVQDTPVMNLLNQPNPYMPRFEFFYGHMIYKDFVGSSYFTGARNGIDDPTEGEIREMYLPAAQRMKIVSGGIANPIKGYFLDSNPDVIISAKNVCQNRHFNPIHQTGYESLYGLPRVFAAKKLIQEFNEGTTLKASINQKRGVRDILFPKGTANDPGQIELEEAVSTQDRLNMKLEQTGNGGIMGLNTEVGVIRVGFSPTELGILESQKDAKIDLCAMFNVSPIIFDWNDRATYNNKKEARKMSLTDAVLPELEILKTSLTNWIIPSYTKDKDYVIDFDDEWYGDLQEDKVEQIKWLNAAPLTSNERREVLGYDRSDDVNADRVVIPSNFQLLESLGTDSLAPADEGTVRDTFGDDSEEDNGN